MSKVGFLAKVTEELASKGYKVDKAVDDLTSSAIDRIVTKARTGDLPAAGLNRVENAAVRGATEDLINAMRKADGTLSRRGLLDLQQAYTNAAIKEFGTGPAAEAAVQDFRKAVSDVWSSSRAEAKKAPETSPTVTRPVQAVEARAAKAPKPEPATTTPVAANPNPAPASTSVETKAVTGGNEPPKVTAPASSADERLEAANKAATDLKAAQKAAAEMEHNNKVIGERMGDMIGTRNVIKKVVEQNFEREDYKSLKLLYDVVSGTHKHEDGSTTGGYLWLAQRAQPDSPDVIKNGRMVQVIEDGKPKFDAAGKPEMELSTEGQLLEYLKKQGIDHPRKPEQIAALLKERPLDLRPEIQDPNLPLAKRMDALYAIDISRRFTQEEMDGFVRHLKGRYMTAEASEITTRLTNAYDPSNKTLMTTVKLDPAELKTDLQRLQQIMKDKDFIAHHGGDPEALIAGEKGRRNINGIINDLRNGDPVTAADVRNLSSYFMRWHREGGDQPGRLAALGRHSERFGGPSTGMAAAGVIGGTIALGGGAILFSEDEGPNGQGNSRLSVSRAKEALTGTIVSITTEKAALEGSIKAYEGQTAGSVQQDEQDFKEQAQNLNVGLGERAGLGKGVGILTNEELSRLAGGISTSMQSKYADRVLTYGEVITSYREGLTAGGESAGVDPVTQKRALSELDNVEKAYRDNGNIDKPALATKVTTSFDGPSPAPK